mgnify:CR=1 FL=1
MFKPKFNITPAITQDLMAIEAARQVVMALPMDLTMLQSLYASAKLCSTHYSTKIEGNRLTQAEVVKVLSGERFPGRERDESEVRNYYRAMDEVERLANNTGPVTEHDIRRIHSLAYAGAPSETPYRDGQNVIRDGNTGKIVYMPPEAKDVPGLMASMVEWLNGMLQTNNLPVPLVSALAHYQFATIHPYYDGNGRTARLVTTLILHKYGYGMKGIYSLEEYYAQNLTGYYGALQVGESHNYYMGRVDADVTPFLAYFCRGMATAFEAVRAQARQASERNAVDESSLLFSLAPRERHLLTLFQQQGTATTADIARHLGLSSGSVRALCRTWVTSGLFAYHDPSKKNRSYRMGEAYRDLH